MTFQEALRCENNAPVQLADGRLGVLIRWWEPNAVGVQVPGEGNIREIDVSRLRSIGGGALVETPETGQ